MTYRDHPLTKYRDEYTIQYQDYDDTWVTTLTTFDRAEADREKDRVSEKYGVQRWRTAVHRMKNPDHGRFRVGQKVKVHPATDAFMRGFTYGRITKVGRRYVTVTWTVNHSVTRKFAPGLLEPEAEWPKVVDWL